MKLMETIFGRLRRDRSKVVVNNVAYQGTRIAVHTSGVRVDGDLVSAPLVGPVTISVEGSVTYLETGSGDVTVKGSAGSVKTESGDVQCGDVDGDVSTQSGDVRCGRVAGNVTTSSGDILKR